MYSSFLHLLSKLSFDLLQLIHSTHYFLLTPFYFHVSSPLSLWLCWEVHIEWLY